VSTKAGTSTRHTLHSESPGIARDSLQRPTWQRPRPRNDCILGSGLERAQRGGSLLRELARDISISEDARKVAADASWCFLTGAYQRLAFAVIFAQQSASLRLPGGTAAIIDATARLPRAGNYSWLKADGVTLLEDIEMNLGWVEVFGASLRRLAGAGHATAEVAMRFRQQGGWAWNAGTENSAQISGAHSAGPVGGNRKRGRRNGKGGSSRGSRRVRADRKKVRRRGASKVLVVAIDD
jgi:hypothetical protein